MARIEASSSGYLSKAGWIESRAARVAIDASGQAIPWLTYPAVRLLSDRIAPSWRVLEFGSGMGTIWWSRRVREVIAVEHDESWASRLSSRCQARIVLSSANTAASYVEPVLDSGPFELVIVDGLFRNHCLAAAAKLISYNGVILLDDAQREEYSEGIADLRKLGFRILELHGPQPVSKHAGCTAILYRNNNVLDI